MGRRHLFCSIFKDNADSYPVQVVFVIRVAQLFAAYWKGRWCCHVASAAAWMLLTAEHIGQKCAAYDIKHLMMYALHSLQMQSSVIIQSVVSGVLGSCINMLQLHGFFSVVVIVFVGRRDCDASVVTPSLRCPRGRGCFCCFVATIFPRNFMTTDLIYRSRRRPTYFAFFSPLCVLLTMMVV